MQTGHPTIILLSRGSCMPSYSPFLDVSILCIFYLQCMFEPVVSLFFFQFQIDYLRIFFNFLMGQDFKSWLQGKRPLPIRLIIFVFAGFAWALRPLGTRWTFRKSFQKSCDVSCTILAAEVERSCKGAGPEADSEG
jgi:hypothetical protein